MYLFVFTVTSILLLAYSTVKQQKLTQSVLEFQNTREAERCVIVESKRHSDLIVIKVCS